MPSDPFYRPPRRWTLGEFLMLPEDRGERVELDDGSLLVSPAPSIPHQRVERRVLVGIDAALPPTMEVFTGVNVLLNMSTMLIPDLAVVDACGRDALFFEAGDVLMVVEIVSPSSRATDRNRKRKLYAEAGIQHYVVIDPLVSPVRTDLFRLGDHGRYESVGEPMLGVLMLTEPVPVTVKLD
ncbi:Uma2 family endonuclease [Actinokineospora fastidiosa]|nr:Uma2 family endonuclease [Actinokineospora fastidiosa]